MQRLVAKQKALWKDDLTFLQSSFNQALDNRVCGFTSEFNNMYKSKLQEIEALKRSVENLKSSIPSCSKGSWFIAIPSNSCLLIVYYC